MLYFQQADTEDGRWKTIKINMQIASKIIKFIVLILIIWCYVIYLVNLGLCNFLYTMEMREMRIIIVSLISAFTKICFICDLAAATSWYYALSFHLVGVFKTLNRFYCRCFPKYNPVVQKVILRKCFMFPERFLHGRRIQFLMISSHQPSEKW